MGARVVVTMVSFRQKAGQLWQVGWHACERGCRLGCAVQGTTRAKQPLRAATAWCFSTTEVGARFAAQRHFVEQVSTWVPQDGRQGRGSRPACRDSCAQSWGGGGGANRAVHRAT
jgi:hypothetical protein